MVFTISFPSNSLRKKPGAIHQFDILCIGDHPSAHVAAAVAKVQNTKLAVGWVAPPHTPETDRLLLVNPKLFDLHPLLAKLRRPFSQYCHHGAIFLSETPRVFGDYACKKCTSAIVSSAAFSDATTLLTSNCGVAAVLCRKTFAIKRVVDDGVEVDIDGAIMTARVLVIGTPLDPPGARVIGHDFALAPRALQTYAFAKLKAQRLPEGKQLVMCLDLAGTGIWAWVLCAGERTELAVLNPARLPAAQRGRDLELWRSCLVDHGVLDSSAVIEPPTTIDLPVAGALTGETVANRTLLVGPAGGFISACNEELYPGCWSAVLAANVAVHALRERHVQDALLSYRQEWGSTVGDYLRGPQQNLKLLLPLIYRNAMMASRVGEAIFLGESVVR